MELTKVDKVFKVYEKVKQLDAEIIELDKVAMQLANDDTEVCLDFKLTNFTEKEKKDNAVVLDNEIKKIAYESFTFSFLSPYGAIADKPKDNTVTFKHEVSTSNALKILGLLLQDKLEKRERLLTKLKNMGVKL